RIGLGTSKLLTVQWGALSRFAARFAAIGRGLFPEHRCFLPPLRQPSNTVPVFLFFAPKDFEYGPRVVAFLLRQLVANAPDFFNRVISFRFHTQEKFPAVRAGCKSPAI